MPKANSRAYLSATRIDIRFENGDRAWIENGVYRFKGADRTRERREATEQDHADLLAAAEGAELQVRILADGSEWKAMPGKIEIEYADGASEQIRDGVYESESASGEEIERPATPEDYARLTALGEGPLGAESDDEDGDDEEDDGGRPETRPERGGDDDDLMRGDRDDDVLAGGAGNDRLDGGKGADILMGDAGDDRLKGGKGDDVLNGGAGDDRLQGQQGADVFVFQAGDGHDLVKDFDSGEDMLNLTAFGFADAAAVLALATETGRGLRLDLAEDSVVMLKGLEAGELLESDLIL